MRYLLPLLLLIGCADSTTPDPFIDGLEREIVAQKRAEPAAESNRVITIQSTGPNRGCTIYRPSVLATDHGVITWGNGTGATSRSYGPFLKSLAEEGHIVIAAETRNAGSGREMLAAAEWVLAAPEYAGKLSGKVAAIGHSQGGGGAYQAAKSPVVTTSVLINPYVPRPGDVPATFGPSFLIAAERDKLVPPSKVARLVKALPDTAVYAVAKGQSHFAAAWSAKPYQSAVIAWLRWQLAGDAGSEAKFREIIGGREWESK